MFIVRTSTPFTRTLKLQANLDFHKVDWLHQPRLRREHGGVEHPSSSGDYLTSASVDGVGMQCHVVDVESDSSQVLVT